MLQWDQPHHVFCLCTLIQHSVKHSAHTNILNCHCVYSGVWFTSMHRHKRVLMSQLSYCKPLE